MYKACDDTRAYKKEIIQFELFTCQTYSRGIAIMYIISLKAKKQFSIIIRARA